MTTYNELQAGMYTAMGYANSATDGSFVWTDTAPSAAIIAAVEAIPQSTANAFYSLDLSTNEEALTLQAIITQQQWDDLLLWQRTQCSSACCIVTLADPSFMWVMIKEVLANGNFHASKNKANTALAAANLSVTVE